MASSLAITYIILLSSFIIILHSPYSISALQRSNETDIQALLAIKAQVTHDPDGFFTSWNDSVHFCRWPGVTCGHLHQRVVSLNLASRGLVGTLSPYVSNLTLLTGLNVEQNSFHGQIPPEIGGLFRLRHLNLTNNSFSGEIPANLSGCISLVFIRFGWNRLTGSIPFQLGKLQILERFHLHYNNLSGSIPESLGNLSSIRSFSFAVNNFQGTIPAVLGQLNTLNFLGLGVNQFSGMIPPAIFNLSSLLIFSVPYNQLEGTLPPDLGFTLPNLQVLNAGHNLLTGQLPTSLSNCSNLVEFDINGGNFTGSISIDFRGLPNLWWLVLASNPLGIGQSGDLQFLDSLTYCRNLKVFDLSNCRFGGTLPHSIANLSTNLLSLRFGGNELSGRIKIGIGNLVNLTELQLQKNKFTGNIPAVLGNLSKLQLLDLSENEFLGHLPSSLPKASQLFLLNLSKNHFNGSIPLSFGNFEYLQELDLSENNLSGTIPRNVISLSSLTLSLNLANNRLSGSLPSDVGELKNLGYLDVSENRLSGEIPSSLGSCVTLERLNMAGNHFEGPIPSSFSSLRGLEYLNLSLNNLSGNVPRFLQSLALKNLDLSFNQLEGQVPNKGIFRNASSFSITGNDKVCGGIPDLGLPICPKKEFGERKSHHGLELMIPLLCGLLALVLVVSLLITRRLGKTPKEYPVPSSSEIRMFSKVSYDSLYKATDGFSSACLVGAGSFGSVYKGTLESDGKVVAIKVFNVHIKGNVKSFVTECKTLRNIRHRNLVKIYTACSAVDHSGNEFRALVYEFMPNGSLESWLHGDCKDQNSSEDVRILGLLQRLNIAIDVAYALNYLHHHCQRAIVHCDLKPSNILLDDDMVAHVGDFGLSKFIPEVVTKSHPLSSSIGIRGTIGYAPPEYGMGSNYSPEGDIYSFGILLLETFTGKRPTDSTFEDGLNLHSFVEAALPDRVKEIKDPTMVQPCSGTDKERTVAPENDTSAQASNVDEELECLISIMRIGVACSTESPKERMDIADVVKELQLIKGVLLAFSTNQCSTSG